MLFLLTALMTTGLYAQNPINITQDKECVSVFQNIKTICDNDNGKLWGINLYAPILCINKSRNIWSNQKDPQGLLNEHDGYFTGTYPETKKRCKFHDRSIRTKVGDDYASISSRFN